MKSDERGNNVAYNMEEFFCKKLMEKEKKRPREKSFKSFYKG